MGLDVGLTNGVTDKRVQVTAGTTIHHDDEAYASGDELVLPGPTAISMELNGYVTILGEA